jgi:hypothetical protein
LGTVVSARNARIARLLLLNRTQQQASRPTESGSASGGRHGSVAEAGPPTGDAAAEPQHPWCRSALAVGLT